MGAGVARSLDLRGAEDQCGDTALKLVRRAMKELEPGQVLEVITDVAEQAFVVRAWSRKTGRDLLEEAKESRVTRMLVRQSADG